MQKHKLLSGVIKDLLNCKPLLACEPVFRSITMTLVPLCASAALLGLCPQTVSAMYKLNPQTCNGHHYVQFDQSDGVTAFVTERPDSKNKKILLCIPAGFTNAYNGIDGLAISRGKVVNSSVDKQLGGALIIINGLFDIIPTNGGSLLTEPFLKQLENSKGSLFQQFQLVKDGMPESFRDKSLFQRRALVVFRDGEHRLVESKEALTLTEFARDLADMDVLNALYTDMGDWDEGWYRDEEDKLITLGTSKKATDKQTSWITFSNAPDNAPVLDRNSANGWLRKHWTPPPLPPGTPPFAEWSRSILYGRFPLPRLSSGYTLVPMYRGFYKKGDIDATIHKIAFGLIDGRPGAVTYTGWSTGGSGYWEVLTLYRIKSGKIQPVGQHSLEDRSIVNGLKVENNAVVLDWNKHGPQDAAIDTSVHEVVKLHSKDFDKIVQSTNY